MEGKNTIESLFKKAKVPSAKELGKMVKSEMETLRIVPFYDPEQYNAIVGITDYFESKVLSLVKESLNDHRELINNIFDESGRVFKVYTYFIKSEIMEEMRVELFYLVKMIKSNKTHKRIVGNLVSYIEGPGVVLNQTNLTSNIGKRKLALSILLFILKSNNTEWLGAYTDLNKELYSFRQTDFQGYNKDNSEYYIAASLCFKNKMKKINKNPNFSLFSKDIDIPRTTLKERLERLKIYDKVKSILKNDGKPSTNF